MIAVLHSLRGVFAVMIFLTHFHYGSVSAFEAGGDCGVAFFIALSGFLMMAGYSARIREITLRGFMSRRIARIYPLHLFCLIAAVVLRAGEISAADLPALAANALLLHSWIPDVSFYFSGNSVAWCLSDLLFFYAIFPWLCRKLLFSRRRFLATFISGYCILIAVTVAIPDRLANDVLYISPVFRLADFVGGMILYDVFTRMKRRPALCLEGRGMAVRTSLELLVVLLLIAAVAAYGSVAERFRVAMLWHPVIAVTLLVFAMLDSAPGLLGRLLTTRPFLWFAGISFGFYMCHVIVIRVMTIIASRIEPFVGPIDGRLMLVACICAAAVAAALLARFLEVPASRLILRQKQSPKYSNPSARADS